MFMEKSQNLQRKFKTGNLHSMGVVEHDALLERNTGED
jgi:hypothetical protein